jgi:hypothetical protein
MAKPPDPSRIRQQLVQTEARRDQHLQVLLDTRLRMIRGSFVLLGKKCGKPNCRCATGEPHPTHYLSISEEGRKRMVHVRSADLAMVRDAAERYRCFREARAALVKLSAEVVALADALQECLVDPYPSASKGGKPRPRRGPRLDERQTDKHGTASSEEDRPASRPQRR